MTRLGTSKKKQGGDARRILKTKMKEKINSISEVKTRGGRGGFQRSIKGLS